METQTEQDQMGQSQAQQSQGQQSQSFNMSQYTNWLNENAVPYIKEIPSFVSKNSSFFIGVTIGCLFTLILDPVSGGRRRSLLRDKGVHFANKSVWFGRKKARHMMNKAHGVAAKASNLRKHQSENNELSAQI
jgi:hypothetical protein